MTTADFPQITRGGNEASQAGPEKSSQDVVRHLSDVQERSSMIFESQKSSGADARGTIAANKGYRCYFTGIDDRIRSCEQIECENDAEAALKAQGLLAASRFTSAEVWQGKRLVGKWGNTDIGTPAA